MIQITPQPLTAAAFAPFGDILDCSGDADKIINQGMCGRFHDRAQIEVGEGAAGISLFNATPRSFPYTLNMMERHPLGSQAFIPMHEHAFLVIVAQDSGDAPATPQAFITAPGQAVNYFANTWHGVLTPLQAPGLFAVVDRIVPADLDCDNLQEYWYDDPYIVGP
jgi:ureidoglycolate lyase